MWLFSPCLYIFLPFFFFENCEWMLFLHEIKDLRSLICMLTSQQGAVFPFVKLSLLLGGSSFCGPFPSSVFCYVHYKVMLGFHVHSCPGVTYLETEPWICWKNENSPCRVRTGVLCSFDFALTVYLKILFFLSTCSVCSLGLDSM